MSKYHKKVLRKQGECIFGNEKPITLGPRIPGQLVLASLHRQYMLNEIWGPPLTKSWIRYWYIHVIVLLPFTFNRSLLQEYSTFVCRGHRFAYTHIKIYGRGYDVLAPISSCTIVFGVFGMVPHVTCL